MGIQHTGRWTRSKETKGIHCVKNLVRLGGETMDGDGSWGGAGITPEGPINQTWALKLDKDLKGTRV